MKFHHWITLGVVWATGIVVLYFLREQVPIILFLPLYLIISAMILVYYEHKELKNHSDKHKKIQGRIEDVHVHHSASKKKSLNSNEYHISVFYSYEDSSSKTNYVMSEKDYQTIKSKLGHLEGMPVTVLVGDEIVPQIDFLEKYRE